LHHLTDKQLRVAEVSHVIDVALFGDTENGDACELNPFEIMDAIHVFREDLAELDEHQSARLREIAVSQPDLWFEYAAANPNRSNQGVCPRSDEYTSSTAALDVGPYGLDYNVSDVLEAAWIATGHDPHARTKSWHDAIDAMHVLQEALHEAKKNAHELLKIEKEKHHRKTARA
jgi:hypothetical protein